MLSSAELTAIRADVASLLPETGYILSVAYTPDGQGGLTEAWGTAGTVTYRLDPLRGEETVQGEAVQAYHAYTLTVPYGTTLTAANRFKAADATTYSVQAVDAGKSWAASKRARVERL